MATNPYINIGQNPLAYSDPFGDTTINPILQTAQKYQALLAQQGGEDLAYVPDFVPTVQTPAETISMTSGEIPAALQGKLTTVGKRLVSQGAQDTKNTLEQLYAQQGIQPQYTAADGSMFAYNPLTGQYDKYYEPPSMAERYLSAIAEAAPIAIATGGLGSALGAATGLSTNVATGLVNAGVSLAQGKPVDEAVKKGLLSYAGGEIGNRVGAGVEAGINPFSEQAGMLADQAAGIGFVSPLATTAASVTNSAIKTGQIDPTAFISGDILQEFGASEVVADAVDFTKAYAQDDYGTMLGIASDYIDLPEGDGLSFDTPEFLKEFDKKVLQPTKDMLEEAGGAVYEDVIKPIGDTVVDVAKTIDDEVIDPFVSTVQETIVDPLQEAGREIDKNVLQPTKDVITDVGETIYEAQKPVGQAIADTGEVIYEDVIKPVGQTVADVGETLYEAQKPIGQAVADVGEAVYEAQKPVGQAIADTATDIYDAVSDAIPDLPSVDLPNVDMPNVNLSWLSDLFKLGGNLGMLAGGAGMTGGGRRASPEAQMFNEGMTRVKLSDPVRYEMQKQYIDKLFGSV